MDFLERKAIVFFLKTLLARGNLPATGDACLASLIKTLEEIKVYMGIRPGEKDTEVYRI